MPWAMFWTFFWLVAREYDALVGDMPEWEENSPLQHNPPKYRRIADFVDDTDAQDETGFRIEFLHEMNWLFGLPVLVRVDRGRLDGKFYTFHREELLIYALMRMTSGEAGTKLCKRCGHKCDSRVGKGFKWFLEYLDTRYDHLIGWNGMLVWRDRFPEFAEKIRQFIARGSISTNPVTGQIQVEPGVWYDPGQYAVTGLVDANVTVICRPRAGPSAPFPGAPRRPWHYEFQRAFWDGHHKVIGVKMLSFLLPNGMYAAVWGPASARREDPQLVHWSHIDDLLYQMQIHYFHGSLYVFFGDSKFRVAAFRCIRGKHYIANGPPVTPQEAAEDHVQNTAREKIEHSYGGLRDLIQILKKKDNFKLEKDPVHALRIIRMAHFFYNLHTCCYGTNVSSWSAFDCKPPSLQEYLNM